MKFKKRFTILGVLMLLVLNGCSIKNDTLEGSTIYTTEKPIEYITEKLYSEYGEISSIYPDDSDIEKYKLTNKQIKKYAKGDLFIYNGLTDEKDLAKTLLNKNSKLLIIDVSYGLTLDNDITELWLSPNNFLMLAKTIKSNLEEYVNNRTIIDNINIKYSDFEEKISILDASLNELGLQAKENNKNTIIADNNAFKYLEYYGFKVVSLQDEANLKDIKIKNIKKGFDDKKYKYIITMDEATETAKDLIANHGAEEIKVDSMLTSLNDDYFNIMNEYIQNIKKIIS